MTPTACAMCGAQKRLTATGRGTVCPHCDQACSDCRVDPETGNGAWCRVGERGRAYQGVGPKVNDWRSR